MTNVEIILAAVQAAFFVALVVGLAFAFRGLRRNAAAGTENATTATTLQQQVRQLEARLEESATDVARLQTQVRELEEQARLVSGAPAKSWTNINRRTQAVRMLRSGSTPDRVASELSITREEVDLIRKVQRFATPEFYDAGPEFTNSKENSISRLRG